MKGKVFQPCNCTVPMKEIIEFYGKRMSNENKARMRRAILSTIATMKHQCHNKCPKCGK